MRKRLRDIARVISGMNQSRTEGVYRGKKYEVYSQIDFDKDYNKMFEHYHKVSRNNFCEMPFLYDGCIVISNVSQKAAIVSPKNNQKLLPMNFTKVEIADEIDSAYFVYLFNNNKDLLSQKEKLSLDFGTVKRLTTDNIRRLEIPIIPYSEQVKIGKIYLESLKVNFKLDQYAEMIEQLTKKILEENMVSEVNE